MSEQVEIINSSFSTEASLYLAYMPFVKGGGLFIRTLKILPIGHPVELVVQLLNEPDPYKINAKVVWITPKGAQGNKAAGIGVQFSGEIGRLLCNKIETYLAGILKSTQFTDTL